MSTSVIPFGDLPRRHAELKGREALAVAYPDGAQTWGELEARSSQRARFLRGLGVSKDDFVVLALPNGCAFHEAAFAVWKLGATPAIVSSRLPVAEFEAIVGLLNPRLVLGGTPGGAAGVQRISATADVSSLSADPFPSETATFAKAMTSGGSTGRPKIIVDHRPSEIDLRVNGLQTTLGFGLDTVMLNPGPLYHNAPFWFTSLGLCCGAQVIGMNRFDAEEALRLIEAHSVEWVCFVPAMMARIWALPQAIRERYDVSSLKRVWHVAAPCPPWLKRAWIDWLGSEKLWELYGGTENYGGTVIRGDEWLAKPGSVGRVLGDTRIKVIGGDGEECSAGEVGELYFRPSGGCAPSHYIGADAKEVGGGWMSLGDLGSVDSDGYVFIADRRTDLIIRGGANVYPAEVEAALDGFPEVISSIVVGLDCDDLGQRVHAIVQLVADQRLDLPALNAFLATRLARYKIPESIEVVNFALRDDAGKARRSALRDERNAWLKEGRTFKFSD